MGSKHRPIPGLLVSTESFEPVCECFDVARIWKVKFLTPILQNRLSLSISTKGVSVS